MHSQMIYIYHILYYFNSIGGWGVGQETGWLNFYSGHLPGDKRHVLNFSHGNFGQLKFSVWDHNLIKKKYFSEFQILAVNGHLRGDGRQASNFSHCHKAGDRGQLN